MKVDPAREILCAPPNENPDSARYFFLLFLPDTVCYWIFGFMQAVKPAHRYPCHRRVVCLRYDGSCDSIIYDVATCQRSTWGPPRKMDVFNLRVLFMPAGCRWRETFKSATILAAETDPRGVTQHSCHVTTRFW